jgi:hypothetical protein
VVACGARRAAAKWASPVPVKARVTLKGPGTYRLHAGGWPRQADEWEECWYVGMSAKSMYERIKSHVCEQGQPRLPGLKPFR